MAQLQGDAHVQEHMHKHRLFFAPRYTEDAVEYANSALTPVHLFLLDKEGAVKPANEAARRMQMQREAVR